MLNNSFYIKVSAERGMLSETQVQLQRREMRSVSARQVLKRSRRWVKQWAKPAVRAALSSRKRDDLPLSLWGLDVAENGMLRQNGVELPDLLSRWGSPLHVVDAARVRENVRAFQSPPAGSTVPFSVFYSYKTNPIPELLRLLHDQGVGAEVISPYELWLAFRLGVPAERIIYNGPAKSDESIREAARREILLLNVNHREELERVITNAQAVGKQLRIGVRVSAQEGWSGQFGTSIATGEAFRTIQEATRSDAVRFCALHAHLGTPIRSEAQLLSFADQVLAFTDVVHQQLGVELEILDFGGSLAVPTVAGLSERERRTNTTFEVGLSPPQPEDTLPIRDYVALLVGRVEQHYRAAGRRIPHVAVEPGRAMTGNTQLLLTRVLELKESRDEPAYAIMDAGINLAETMRYEFHQVFPASKMRRPAERTYRLAGPICSPGDVLVGACPLPMLERGDVLAFMDSGAYFVPFATSFSFPQPAIVLIDQGRETLLRRAEAFEDLIALDGSVADSPGGRRPAG